MKAIGAFSCKRFNRSKTEELSLQDARKEVGYRVRRDDAMLLINACQEKRAFSKPPNAPIDEKSRVSILVSVSEDKVTEGQLERYVKEMLLSKNF